MKKKTSQKLASRICSTRLSSETSFQELTGKEDVSLIDFLRLTRGRREKYDTKVLGYAKKTNIKKDLLNANCSLHTLRG